MKSIHPLLFVLSAAIVPASVANASHELPLEVAACEYHEAVKHFDLAVHEVRFIDHDEMRLVHQLADAACDLHRVARHPERTDRVLHQWRDVQSLHRCVQAAIFGRSCYPRHPELIKCWQRVTCAYRELAKQVECICGDHHVYRPPVGGTAFGLPPVIEPHAVVPRAVPYAFPGTMIPRTPFPPFSGMTLPHAYAPTTPRIDSHVRPGMAPLPPVDPSTDEIRYFGRRPFDQPRTSRNNIGAHFTGNDFRSAMIGAMLSRMSH